MPRNPGTAREVFFSANLAHGSPAASRRLGLSKNKRGIIEPCLRSGPEADLRIATPKLGSIDPILPLQFIELDQHIFMSAGCDLPVHKVG